MPPPAAAPACAPPAAPRGARARTGRAPAAVHAEEVELAADAALPMAEAGSALPVAQGSAVVDVPTRRERAAPIPVVLGQPVVAAVVGTIRSPRCPRRRSAIVFAAVAVAAAVVVAVAAVASVNSSATDPCSDVCDYEICHGQEDATKPECVDCAACHDAHDLCASVCDYDICQGEEDATKPECIECATCQSRHGGSSDSPPPSPSFEVPDCPGLGPCFNERGDNTQVLFWLWVGFFAFFALCCCACIVFSAIGRSWEEATPDKPPRFGTELSVWALLCACLGLIIAIGLVIAWRVQMSETFDAPPGGSIVCGVGTKLNAAGNGCDLDEGYTSSEVSYSYDEFEGPHCPGIGPCFNESGDNTQVLFWLWVGSFSLCGFAFIIVMCSSATAADAETTPPCLSGCRTIMCLSLVLAIGLVIGWRVRMSEIDDINRYAVATKQSCAAGTCTRPHCCEADGVHDDGARRTAALARATP